MAPTWHTTSALDACVPLAVQWETHLMGFEVLTTKAQRAKLLNHPAKAKDS
ncbi:hypothetical protein C2845_PM12G13890 [Panicum miliaceum]|uniref:Uncharacterized protein n=1 Tax=Panicum miliaceum TaxID=4540 RepID=A0A3L6QJC7_PANMI|nr:hypothetical protein C2845_PM12G13890 [Panicum miliaceum]